MVTFFLLFCLATQGLAQEKSTGGKEKQAHKGAHHGKSADHVARELTNPASSLSFLTMKNQFRIYDGDAWPLPEGTFSHPRSNGTFAKILRSYVRERKLMTMQEALRKMCLMPAQTLEGFVPQMKKKGRLQNGMDADIVVFDPATIRDVGTYEKPNQPAVGVQSLLVNGAFVVDGGELVLEAAAGRPIRRTAQKR